MARVERFSGLLSPVLTPFGEDLSPDMDRLISHGKWLLQCNCNLAPFGTTSEGNSLSAAEKADILDRLVAAGIPAASMMPGTGTCAIADTVTLSAKAAGLGCGGVLMLPPFYYKNVSDDGLYAAYDAVIQQVGSADLKIYLYHIPPMSQTPISLSLIERLLKAYPETVVGIKDSSGEWNNTKAMLDAKFDDFRIFVGSESFLLANMRNGGAGCISATANVNPSAIYELYEHWRDNDAEDRQADLDAVRDIFVEYAAIPALKACVAHFAGDPGWALTRPPLMPLDAEKASKTIEALLARGFDMPGLAGAKAAAE